MNGSERYALTVEDSQKIGKGLLIAIGGAALTYLSEMIPNVDFGQWTPVVVAAWSAVLNIARKYLSDNTDRREKQ